jgi:hypothetical protein
MPKEFYDELAKRGGASRWRTISLGNGKYAHVAITPKAGKHGGHTLIGEVHEQKRMRV